MMHVTVRYASIYLLRKREIGEELKSETDGPTWSPRAADIMTPMSWVVDCLRHGRDASNPSDRVVKKLSPYRHKNISYIIVYSITSFIQIKLSKKHYDIISW